jgi:hypothetical protein
MFMQLISLAAAMAFAQPPKPRFEVECRLVELQKAATPDKEGDSNGRKSGHIVTHRITTVAPKVSLCSDQPAMIANECQRPFVTAFKTTSNGKEPVITILKEGIRVDFSLESVDSRYVTLDATIQDSRIGEVEERIADEQGAVAQAPTVETKQIRFVGSMRLGEKREIPFNDDSDRSVEFVIHRSGALAESMAWPGIFRTDGLWEIKTCK